MKSELYEIIYKVALFCIVASLGLSIGGGGLCWYVFHSVGFSGGQQVAAVVTAVFGAVLFFVSIAVMLYFKKKYKSEVAKERDEIEEDMQEDGE